MLDTRFCLLCVCVHNRGGHGHRGGTRTHTIPVWCGRVRLRSAINTTSSSSYRRLSRALSHSHSSTCRLSVRLSSLPPLTPGVRALPHASAAFERPAAHDAPYTSARTCLRVDPTSDFTPINLQTLSNRGLSFWLPRLLLALSPQSAGC